MEIENLNCVICGQTGHGNHFGVISCRACAAFFRRQSDSKWNNMKCLSKHCDGDTYHCKPCRLKKCRDVGMNNSRFQYGRDTLRVVHNNKKQKIPQTMESFFGRHHLVIFHSLDPHGHKKKETYVDVSLLIFQAKEVLKMGSEKPLMAKNLLQKLNFGFNCMKGEVEVKRLTLVTKKEVTGFWEYHLLTTAKWLAYFDKFLELDDDLKTQILLAVWHVWGRLDRLMSTALYRQKNKDASLSDRVVANGLVTDMEQMKEDLRWMSSYPIEQLRYFLNGIRGDDLLHFIEELQNLDITETELSFMLSHLCFEYAANRFGGKIGEAMEQFQEIISNDLHDYYVTDRMMPRYSARLVRLLNVNKGILESIRSHRNRAEIAKVFNVFNLDFSHPEMFFDTGLVC